MIREMVLFIFLLALLVFLLVRNRRLEQRKLKGKVRDFISPKLRQEIEEEREATQARKKRFEEALQEAEGKEPNFTDGE